MAKILGHDISHHQGNVDFTAYKQLGNSKFNIIKASEGVGYTDPKFIRNRDGLRKVGVLVGYYHFARPDLGNKPEVEADYFLKTIGQLAEGEILALDYELNTSSLQKQEHVTWCKKWLDIIFERTGVKPLIYLNQSQVQRFNWKEVVDGGYGLWIAAYTYNPDDNTFKKGQWEFAAMQQYTSKQQVNGIEGNVDGNVFFGDLDTLKRYGYQVGVTPEPEPEPTPPVEENINLKKKLSDNDWNTLIEFKQLMDRGLIIRDDSIQSQVIKWLEIDEKKDRKIEELETKLQKAKDQLKDILDSL